MNAIRQCNLQAELMWRMLAVRTVFTEHTLQLCNLHENVGQVMNSLFRIAAHIINLVAIAVADVAINVDLTRSCLGNARFASMQIKSEA